MFRSVRSMQWRLLASLLAGVALVWLGVAVCTWIGARHEVDELLDGHLAHTAALLVVQQAQLEDEVEGPQMPVQHEYAPRVAFQVFLHGALLSRSSNVGTRPMSAVSSGFDTVTLEDGTRWRVFALQSGSRQVLVGEQLRARRGILMAVLRGVLLPMLVALPMLAVLIWWSARRALAPLNTLRDVLQARAPRSTVPLALNDLPSEMRPMVQALNALLARMDQMVEVERRFTADAAHELRTPIAAIRAQAQVALGAVDDVAERRHALHLTLLGCDRAAHLVDQLLTLARLDAPLGEGAGARRMTDLAAVAHSVAADLAPQALGKRQDLELQAPPGCWVDGPEVLLRVLLRNLLDNAVRYAPVGAVVKMALLHQDGSVQLHVQDSGPGMSEADMARLGERFFRVLGPSETGSGLGWSIVHRVALVTGAQITVQRSLALGGLWVQARWPAAAGDAKAP